MLGINEHQVTQAGHHRRRMAMLGTKEPGGGTLDATEEGVTTLGTTAERTPMLGINEQQVTQAGHHRRRMAMLGTKEPEGATLVASEKGVTRLR